MGDRRARGARQRADHLLRPNTNKTHTVLRNLIFPNGICVASDGQSILFAETWGCTVKRYWFDRPKSGKVKW